MKMPDVQHYIDQLPPTAVAAIKVTLVVLGVLAIIMALKSARFFSKIVFALIGLALVGGAAWWIYSKK
jgi:hypothetical protein